MRLYLLLTLLVASLLSCGDALETAQKFKPNNAPVVDAMTGAFVNPGGVSFDENALIAHMTFDITVEAHDPDGQPLTYSYTSGHGSFSGQNDTAAGSTVKFMTGILKAGDKVSVTLTLTDTKNGVTVRELPIGTGKPVPGVTVTSWTAPTSSAAGSVTLLADCDGFAQVVEDDLLIPATALFDGTHRSFVLVDKGIVCTLTVPALAGASSGDHRIWILFQDYLSQNAEPKLYTVTLP